MPKLIAKFSFGPKTEANRMALIPVSEITGAALDWAVAKCVEADTPINKRYGSVTFNPKSKRVYQTEGLMQIGVNFAPSSNWAHGGPIVGREIDQLKRNDDGTFTATIIKHEYLNIRGASTLIAAMRCYVASKLGDSVEVPDELI